MGLISWYNEKLKKLNFWDIAAIKTNSFLWGMVIGAALAVWVLPYWWAFIIIGLLISLKVIKKVL